MFSNLPVSDLNITLVSTLEEVSLPLLNGIPREPQACLRNANLLFHSAKKYTHIFSAMKMLGVFTILDC